MLSVGVSGGGQAWPPVVVPAISETTKRSFNQTLPAGSTAVQDQQDSTRPSSAVIRSALYAVHIHIHLSLF